MKPPRSLDDHSARDAFDGSIRHGGGANQATEVRIGLAMNYCAGLLRQ